jgi:hypothetical protein
MLGPIERETQSRLLEEGALGWPVWAAREKRCWAGFGPMTKGEGF